MDYLITFEDGTEAHLEHHGVKGMKWRKGRKTPTGPTGQGQRSGGSSKNAAAKRRTRAENQKRLRLRAEKLHVKKSSGVKYKVRTGNYRSSARLKGNTENYAKAASLAKQIKEQKRARKAVGYKD